MELNMRRIRILSWIIFVTMFFATCLSMCVPASDVMAYEGAYYCDDGYGGEGESIDVSYTVTYDSYVENRDYYVSSAPSYSKVSNDHSNDCASKTGGNIVGFYDRYYTNLISNFDPGILMGSTYVYFPYAGIPAIRTMIESLYDLMEINVNASGATKQDFMDGLTEYVEGKGYDISFSSFYGNTTTVNLNQVRQMVQNNKVGVLMCSRYNYIYAINHSSSGTSTYISQRNFNIGHMMMVYGYITINFYNEGIKTKSETFLQVSSGFDSGDQGYIKMDDYLNIDDALIVNIE